VQAALESDPSTWPEVRSGEKPDPRLDSIVALLGVVATARATAQDVSRNYLAPRDALFDLANWWLKNHEVGGPINEELAILSDWRGEILGRDLLKLLDGEAVIALDKSTGLPELRAN
jgi:ribonuclease D